MSWFVRQQPVWYSAVMDFLEIVSYGFADSSPKTSEMHVTGYSVNVKHLQLSRQQLPHKQSRRVYTAEHACTQQELVAYLVHAHGCPAVTAERVPPMHRLTA